ncbi:hypothetical protein L3Q72_18015 [Vibrio sp. JC009]|uniref:hypothetical protein n=1 Tax=Vibrio sp. JC009 TaxID=2912314 RepID=UPI0023AEAD6B|nr:hypothetical protein [Vibrio sp. JC009]WED24772.1 hypothetical protein L3Q72_18015 [Vibrio sp. JC009]
MDVKLLSKVILLLAVLISGMNNSVFASEETEPKKVFHMAMIRPETQLFGKWQRLVYDELFSRLNMEVTYRDFPARRASDVAAHGKVDGEPARPKSYVQKYDTMIRIEEPVFAVNFSAFSTKELPAAITDWKSFAKPKLAGHYVEYRRGIHICANNLPLYVEDDFLSATNSTHQGLCKLRAGYSDIFVDEETGVFTLLNTDEFEQSGIRRAGVVVSIPAYMHIHEKNRHLVDKLTKTIREMKEEGLIQRYREQLDREFGVNNTAPMTGEQPDCDSKE